ncbi:MAG TPA: hypothetical protein VF534_17835 [Paraburkholderia sp.]
MLTDQEQFSAWVEEYRKGKPCWSTAREEILWDGWQASRAHALEAAAKVCDEKQDWYEEDRCIGQATAVGACADEIRALIPPKEPTC